MDGLTQGSKEGHNHRWHCQCAVMLGCCGRLWGSGMDGLTQGSKEGHNHRWPANSCLIAGARPAASRTAHNLHPKQALHLDAHLQQ